MTSDSTSGTAPTSPATEQARQFLAAVGAACSDLPETDRVRLLGGLEEHLAELSADGVDLDAELGSPTGYANELRASAGLPPVPVGPPGVSPAAAATASMPAATSWQQGGHPGAYAPPPGGGSWSTGAKVALVAAVVAAALVAAVVLFGVLGVFMFASGGSSVSSTSVATAPAAPGAPTVVTVPDLVGMSADEARRTLEDAGLVSASLVVTTTPPPGGQGPAVVLGQDPAPGTDVPTGTTITLTVTG